MPAMYLTPEQTQQLAPFPTALMALVEAELRAGNVILEIAAGHPAPPVGACVKLARKVRTRPRASGEGLHFHERNGSLYSGEFTDANRFFFVLEPPDPPPPEPDMDAIRAAHEPKPDPLLRLARRQPASGRLFDPRSAGPASPDPHHQPPPAPLVAETPAKLELDLDSIESIQRAILDAMKRGGSFATSHKEGGTRILWRHDRFVRSDFGDFPDHQEFTDPTEFLQMLRRFCHADVTRHAGPNPLPEIEEWKRILGRLRPH